MWLVSQCGSRSATTRVPSRSLCKSGLPRPLPGNATSILLSSLETKRADFLCQALEVLQSLTAYEQVFLRNQRSPTRPSFNWVLFSCPARSLRTDSLAGGPNCWALRLLLIWYCVLHFWSHEYWGIVGPPSRSPMLGKATIPLGGCLVSQRAPFETD